MDWSNERYVRVYTRDTTTWKLLDWRARTVLLHMFRKVDRAGVLDVGHDGVLGLAAVLELPIEIVEAGIAQLTRARGGTPTVLDAGNAYVIPNYIEAQESPSSDPQRKRESRARRRDRSIAESRNLLLPAAGETSGHDLGPNRDAESLRSEPSRTDQIQDQDRARSEPPVNGSPARPPAAVSHPAWDPSAPGAIFRVAESTWRAISDARVALAAELGMPPQLPWPAITPASPAGQIADLMARVRGEGAGAPVACALVVQNLIDQAREERDLTFLSAKAFSPGGWDHARNYVPGSKRSRAGPRSAARDVRVGAVQPREPSAYPEGEIEIP